MKAIILLAIVAWSSAASFHTDCSISHVNLEGSLAEVKSALFCQVQSLKLSVQDIDAKVQELFRVASQNPKAGLELADEPIGYYLTEAGEQMGVIIESLSAVVKGPLSSFIFEDLLGSTSRALESLQQLFAKQPALHCMYESIFQYVSQEAEAARVHTMENVQKLVGKAMELTQGDPTQVREVFEVVVGDPEFYRAH